MDKHLLEMTNLSQERTDEYFSTLNPLAAKIWRDIKKIEASVENFDSLSYDQKCAVIDKRILEGGRTEDTEYLPSFGEQDYTSTLLMAVYPTKPDKYIYDDNACWIDGHSACPTACSMSQANACKLADLVKKITFKRASKKYRAPSKPPAFFNTSVEENYGDATVATIVSKNHTSSAGNKSVVVTSQPNKKKDPFASLSSGDDCGNPEPELMHDVDDNLPHQKQNLELIAELQAKLKKSKQGGKAVLNPVSVTSVPKITKPKAPPPPPPSSAPKVQGAKDKVRNPQENSTAKMGKPMSPKPVDKADDEFKVDISSPCRIATPKTGFDFLDNW